MFMKFSYTLLTIGFLFLTKFSFGQTVLAPGDIILVHMSADMGDCGLEPGSDEFSFFCFKDIETGTTIDITDNGWERVAPNFFGDAEGTIRLTRTGGTIPKGTVITVQSRPVGGWTHRLYPDNNWTVDNLNVPGGNLDLEGAGDQIFFMQGGEWNNGGGGANRATYSGTLIFGFNNLYPWSANGTNNHSNLPPSLSCYHASCSDGVINPANVSWIGPWEELNQFEWLEQIKNVPWWGVIQNCTDLAGFNPTWPLNTVPLNMDLEVDCLFCEGCSPYTDYITMSLPTTGTYNVTYTDGVQTYTATGLSGNVQIPFEVVFDTVITIVSIEQVNGCTIYSGLNPDSVEFSAIYNDPGLPGEVWVCPQTNPPFNLWYFLGGTPAMGGVWSNSEFNIPGGMYTTGYGEGKFTYYLPHPHGSPCVPPFDSASVYVHFIDLSGSIVEVGCDQNGTPYNINDDRIVLTLTVLGDGFGPGYNISASHGSITPTFGTAGVPSVFLFDPGTATGVDKWVMVDDYTGFNCGIRINVPAPGYCSDPCDPFFESVLQGPDGLCINNCEGEPDPITISITDGNWPYKADFTLQATGQPTVSYEDVPIDEFTEINVCVVEGATLSFDASTNTIFVPASLSGSGFTFNVDVLDKFNCLSPINTNDLYISIASRPSIGKDTIRMCRYDANPYDLTNHDENISAFLDVEWYDGNPFLGGERIVSPNFANMFNIVDLWAYVEDGECGNSVKVPFFILPTPNLDSIPPIKLCVGEELVLSAIPKNDLGNSNPIYSYHTATPPDSSNILNPDSFFPTDSMTIYILARAGICTDTLAVFLDVQDVPTFSLTSLPCNLLAGTYTVEFSSTADSVYTTAGTVMYGAGGNHSIINIPNNTNITIELYNPTELCADTFAITAPNCNCATINPPVASNPNQTICDDETIPTFTVTIDPGLVNNWYAIPSGGLPVLSNSVTFTPTNPINSTFYAEAVDPATNCPSLRTPVSLVVNTVPELQPLADIVECADQNTINFSALNPAVINGVPGTGSWINLQTMAPVSGNVSVSNGQSFGYTFTSTSGNCVAHDTISVQINPLPDLAIYAINCDDIALTYSIGFETEATQITVNAGILNQVPGTDSFTVSDIPFDTDLSFTLINEITGCQNTVSFEAPDCSCPPLLGSGNDQICASAGSVNLSVYQNVGIQGNWTIESTPPGGSPATLTGTSLNINNADPGVYRLLFVRNVILDDCIDSAFFDITLSLPPTVDAGVDGNSCDQDVIALSGTVQGAGTIVGWTTTGSGSLSQPNNPNTNYTPSLADITSGSVSFTLTGTDPSGVCPVSTETITYTIDGDAFYLIESTALQYCDTTDEQFLLSDLITFGNNTGQWFIPGAPAGAIINGNTLVPGELEAGTYFINYAPLSANPPCTIDTTEIQLIIENCLCPSVAVTDPVNNLCSEAGTLVLSTLLITTEPGSWSIVGQPAGGTPATIIGGVFTSSNSTPGNYVLRYTLTNPMTGCDEYAEIDIDITPTPQVTLVSALCSADLQSWTAVFSSTAPDLTSSTGVIVPLGGNQYSVSGITIGTSLDINAQSADGLCTDQLNIPSPDCDCTLSIAPLNTSIQLCEGETVTLTGTALDPKGDVKVYWHIQTDTTFSSSIVANTAGSYTFTAEDDFGCKAEETVVVSYYEEMIPDFGVQDVICPGDLDGSITLFSIQGGQGPFMISVNGSAFSTLTTFPHIIDQLGVGTYTIELMDAGSCVITEVIQLQGPANKNVSLGNDQVIIVGDSVSLNPVISFVPASFIWSGDLAGIDISVLNQYWGPEEDQLITLTATDENGCTFSDQVFIRVLLESAVDVPNVFSPNGDGINDLIAPNYDPSIVSVEVFEIYSRWGELLFSRKSLPAFDPDLAWDGTFRDKVMEPGVYTYRLHVKNVKNKEIMKTGDITLVR